MQDISKLTAEQLIAKLNKVNIISAAHAKRLAYCSSAEDVDEVQRLRFKLTFREYFSQRILQSAHAGHCQLVVFLDKDIPWESSDEFNTTIMRNAFFKHSYIRKDLSEWLQDNGYFVLETAHEFIIRW